MVDYVIIEGCIKLIYIPMANVRRLNYPLCKIFLDDTGKFVSLTRIMDEYSLIIDESLFLENFNSSEHKLMVIDEKEYQIIQIYEENNGIDDIGVVNSISKMFTDANISILYINSFNNNFIVVPREMIPTISNEILPRIKTEF